MKRLFTTMFAVSVVALTVIYSHAKDLPPQDVVGTWRGNVEIFGPFKTEPYPSKAPEDHQDVIIAISSSSSVTGRIGQAVFSGCSFKRNRGWVGRKLNLKTDFIIRGGHLDGKITPKDKGEKREFTIPFNIENGKLVGTIMLLPKFPLTRLLNLEKDK